MLENIKIKPIQLFCSIVLVNFGSAVLLDVARNAGKDAWITLLLGTVCGLLIYSIYMGLFHYYPHLPLTAYLQKIWGTHFGWLVGLLYVTYFIYLAARILRDFAELISITSYPNTEILLISLVMILSISYTVMKGFYGFGRISTVCLFCIFAIIVFIIFGEILTGLLQVNRLLPILENGWQPVFRTLFPTVITAPFGEVIVFTMLLPYVSKKEKGWKYGSWAIIVSGIYLAVSSMTHIMALGEELTKSSNFPILSAYSLVNIADFISRLNAVVVFGTVILGFFKIGIFFFCAVLGTAQLFKVKEGEKLVLPIAIIILFSAIASARSFIAHVHEGFKVVPFVLHLPFQIIIPLLLLGTAFLQHRKASRTPT